MIIRSVLILTAVRWVTVWLEITGNVIMLGCCMVAIWEHDSGNLAPGARLTPGGGVLCVTVYLRSHDLMANLSGVT